MKITINAYVARAMTLGKLDVARCESALKAAYNDGTTVIQSKERMTGAVADEKRNLFRSREAEGKVREGKLTDPLRFIAWNSAFDAYASKHAPSGEITLDVIPVSHLTWLRAKFGPKKAARMTAPTRANKPAVTGASQNGAHAPATVS